MQQQAEVVGQVKGDAPVSIAEGLEADPRDLARGDEAVEVGGPIAFDPCGQNLPLQLRRGHRRTLQLLDDVEQRVEAGASPRHTLPA